jgi:hypothetical protein
VYTTGQLQQAVYVHHQHIGRTAVIVGAEHVSFSAAMTLHHAGARVAAMVTELPRHQSFIVFRAGAALAYRFPVLTATTVTRINGSNRVHSVEIRRSDGTTSQINCDIVVFTGDWIPDHELARRRGLVIDPGTAGPAVDTAHRTSDPRIFAAGNLLHPVATADAAALDGRLAARSVARTLLGTLPTAPSIPVIGKAPLKWIAPNHVDPTSASPHDQFTIWSTEFARCPRLTVTQDGLTLWSSRSRRTLIPNRALHLKGRWAAAVNPVGGPVIVHLCTDGE